MSAPDSLSGEANSVNLELTFSGKFVMLRIFLPFRGRPNENECFPAAETKRERMGSGDEGDPAGRLHNTGAEKRKIGKK